MESHIHYNIGGIIACAGPQKLQEMSIYIECKEGDCLEFP